MDMNVRILRWPEQADEADRLARLEVPRLLIVESGVPPPTETSCVADWLRLPADDADLSARLAALSKRAAQHPSQPFVDDDGQVSHRETTAFLSSIDERVTKILIEHFGHPVPAKDLIRCGWPQDGTNETLRVHISRLRHRIAPLGLTITNIRGHGYVMREAEATDTTRRSPRRVGAGRPSSRRRRPQRVVTTKPSTRASPDRS